MTLRKPLERGPVPYRPKKPGKKRNWRRIALGSALAVVVLFVLGLASLAGAFWYYGRDLPDVAMLREYRPPQTTRVLDRNGRLVGEIFVERRTVVPMEEIPRVVVLSVLAAEDADFYTHRGLDFRGIARAILRDLATGKAAQGASTITQQVVKLMLLSSERTLSRKVRELILARRLEQELSKEEILHLYLNHINFGDGHYGIEEAARYYFGKHARELTLAEASMLAGIPQSPARLNPFRNPDRARRRQLYTLGQLEAKRNEYWPDLSSEAITTARQTELVYADPDHETSTAAPEVMQLARTTLRELVGDEAYRRGGFTVHTTIDLGLVAETRAALRAGLAQVDERNGYRGPLVARPRTAPAPAIDRLRQGRTYEAEVTEADDGAGRIYLDVGGHRAYVPMTTAERYDPTHLPPSQFAAQHARVPVSIDVPDQGATPARARLELGPEGAVVVIDPRTRHILALVGGSEAHAGFNRATQALRQPGSTFKAFVYAQAIRSRTFTPASTLTIEDLHIGDWQLRVPESEQSLEPVRLRVALARSINPIAVKLLQAVGAPSVIAFARSMGISTELTTEPSLALGASDVHPLEIVNAYATFAAGGRYQDAEWLARIVGPDGRAVPLPRKRPPEAVMTPAEAFVVTSLLRSVVEEGTATAAKALRRPLAGKTGTSNDARDTWFIGFSPNTVVGVWVGFDDRRPLGRRESGARTALPIWMNVMRAAERDRRPSDFPLPGGVVTARIDPASGLLAPEGAEGALEEVFLEGTAPVEVAPVILPVELPPPFPEGVPPVNEMTVGVEPMPTPAPTPAPAPAPAPTPAQ